MQRTPLSFLCLQLALLVSFSSSLEAQRKIPRREQTPGTMIKESDVDYRLWEGFLLVQKANKGEPAAQHELGIRYLQGRGFEADTAKALYWIQRAAASGFDLAHYNLGIFSMNGWGVPWDPFLAYRHFQHASEQRLPEADFVLGLLLTEDLVVPRDWRRAYEYVRRSADAGFEPARKALVEFERRGLSATIPNEHGKRSIDSLNQHRPVFLDFDIDTVSRERDRALLDELLREGGEELRRKLGVAASEGISVLQDAEALDVLRRTAEGGSPEALTLLGWMHEHGVMVTRDRIHAAAFYVRALRVESPRATSLLWALVQQEDFIKELERRSGIGEATAQFVWAGLAAARIDLRLSGEDALGLLRASANQNFVDAIIELGLCYQSGRWIAVDKRRTVELWQLAERLGSQEAKVRIAVLHVLGDQPVDMKRVTFLREKTDEGSILAEVALGYCYQRGLGVGQNHSEAARLYRNAAQRGSQSAYLALRRMHDEIRPDDEEFRLE